MPLTEHALVWAYIGDGVPPTPEPWTPGANTLFYYSLDQSDADFTDAMGHTTNNNGILYSANGVNNGCGENHTSGKRIQGLFNSGETFPSQFTIMAFIKPSGNHYTSDYPMGIVLSNATNKTLFWIWFNQSNTSVQWNYLKENVAWDSHSISLSYSQILNYRHHYALTYDGTTIKGYRDGVEEVSRNPSGTWSWSYYPVEWFTLFGRVQSAWQYTNTIQGFVDEAICENKVWTAQEIQDYLANYNYLAS